MRLIKFSWLIHDGLNACHQGLNILKHRQDFIFKFSSSRWLWKLAKHAGLLEILRWGVEIMFINKFISRLIFAKMWGRWNTLVWCMPWKIWVIPSLMIVSISDMIIICLSIRLCCVYMIWNKFWLGQSHMRHGSLMQGICGCSRDRNWSIFLFKISSWSKKFGTSYIYTLQNQNFSGRNHKQLFFLTKISNQQSIPKN